MRSLVLLNLALASFMGSPAAQAAPKAHADLNVVQLLLSFETEASRTLSSFSREALALTHMPVPYIQLTKDLILHRDGVTMIGPSCSVRAIAKRAGYFNGVLDTTPGIRLRAKARYDFDTIRLRPDSFSAVFISGIESVNAIEISCNHEKVKDWTLSQFEAHSANAFEIHTYVQKNTKSILRFSGIHGMKIKDLKGAWYNELFGSGLPKTAGMQILIGTDLKAYREPTSTPIVKGARCTLLSQESDSLDTVYQKDSKYAFVGYKTNPQEKTVELIFGNWNYSPHQIRVKCSGDEKSILAMNTQEIERDLNGSVHFYHK